MRKTAIPILMLLYIAGACQVYRPVAGISGNDLFYSLQNLASESFGGRYPGTHGDSLAGAFIRDQLSAARLNPVSQDFTFLSSVRNGPQTRLAVNGNNLPAGDFVPFPWSADSMASAGAVFAGYGLNVQADSFSWNDYGGIDPKGKWVILLRGIPVIPEYEKYLAPGTDDRDKVMLAMDNGAAGVILISGLHHDPSDRMVEVSGKPATVAIPVFQVSRRAANGFFMPQGISVDSLENRISRNRSPVLFPLEITLDGKADIEQIHGTTANHYALLEGTDPAVRNEYIVVGGHFDHLGTGGRGSSSLRPDTLDVHNGADDNASGVAVMLELAGAFSLGQEAPRRSMIFVAFGGEEMGLLGSKYFVSHAPVDLTRIVAMINLDMVGRLDTAKGLQVGGAGTSLEADSLIRSANKAYGLKLLVSREGSGPSDHASFYGKDIPVFFLTSGVHPDYHTPDDDTEKINFEGLGEIAGFTEALVRGIDRQESRLSFRESGPKESSGPGFRFRVTLGFMPDFTDSGVEGVRVDFVSKGKPAERGGILKGDIIRAIDNMPVRNIYDYMYRLSKLTRGRIISVEILRGGQTLVLPVQL